MPEKILFEIKPSAINALFPLFLKNLFYNSLWGLGLALILIILKATIYTNWTFTFILILTITAIILISLLLNLGNFISLKTTTYKFYKTRIVIEKKILSLKTRSAHYSHIVNTNLEISIWDRMINAGDLILHNAEDSSTGDIKLLFIKNPQKIEKKIHDLIAKNKKR